MKITSKIQECRDTIITNPGGGLAAQIQDQSVQALLNGIASDEWRDYMSNFSSNPDQLERLCGNDQTFMEDESGWGPLILAYIGGSGPCGGGTRMSMAVDMPVALKNLLDDGVSDATA